MSLKILVAAIVINLAQFASADPTPAATPTSTQTPAPTNSAMKNASTNYPRARSGRSNSNYKSPAHWGFGMQMTDDGPKLVVARYNKHSEFWLTPDSNWTWDGGKTGDIGLNLFLGYRWNMSDISWLAEGMTLEGLTQPNLNTVTAGMHWYNNFNSYDAGIKTNTTFSVGPYVGFQRVFSDSPVIISAFILPIAYTSEWVANGNGGQTNVRTYSIFEQGGVGITYLY